MYRIHTLIYNNYTNNKITLNDTNTTLKIDGYNQNYHLFFDIKHKLLSYFNLNDIAIQNDLCNKYNITSNEKNIMLGIRMCDDFKHMTKINKLSYIKALNKFISKDEKNYNLIILSDIKNDWQDKLDISSINGKIIIVDEDDISQIYMGMMCNYFILSESTYHYWIAMFKYSTDPSIKVVVFNDTDLTNRPLALPEWIHIDY